MATATVNRWARPALEYGPILGFVAAYLVVREQSFALLGREVDGFVLLVGAFVPVLVTASAAMWWLAGRVTPVQVLTLVIVVISGGLTFGLNDERFFKMRTTVVCLTLSGVLWAGLWRGHSYLAALFQNLAALPHEGWMLLTRRLAWALLTLAAANEIMWRNFSTDVWVAYDAFVQPLAFFAFLAWQIRVARRTRR